MSRRATSLALLSLAAASFVTLGSAPASAKDAADWALEFISNATVNEWGNEPECYINWEQGPEGEEAWSGKTKAACFFTLALQKSMGYSRQDVYSLWGKYSPTSDYYFDLINASPAVGTGSAGMETYFRRVTRAVDIQKGDIFAIGATSSYAGHTLIITGAPIDITSRQIMPRYSGTRQYAVPIADSTESSHGCNAAYPDSRWSGQCTGGYSTSGAGTGFIRVYTDALTGILLGYTWSVTSSTTSYYSPSTRPYRIGRLFKLPDPLPTEPPPPPP